MLFLPFLWNRLEGECRDGNVLLEPHERALIRLTLCPQRVARVVAKDSRIDVEIPEPVGTFHLLVEELEALTVATHHHPLASFRAAHGIGRVSGMLRLRVVTPSAAAARTVAVVLRRIDRDRRLALCPDDFCVGPSVPRADRTDAEGLHDVFQVGKGRLFEKSLDHPHGTHTELLVAVVLRLLLHLLDLVRTNFAIPFVDGDAETCQCVVSNEVPPIRIELRLLGGNLAFECAGFQSIADVAVEKLTRVPRELRKADREILAGLPDDHLAATALLGFLRDIELERRLSRILLANVFDFIITKIMLMDMIKKPKTIDDVFEKLGELATRAEVDAKISTLATRDEMNAEIGGLHTKIDDLAINMKMRMDTLVTRDEMNVKIDASVGGLAIMVEKGFAEAAQDLSALTERVGIIETIVKGHDKEFINIHGDFNMVIQELKTIRNRLDQIEKYDAGVDVIDLDLRVRKLEKKARLQ